MIRFMRSTYTELKIGKVANHSNVLHLPGIGRARSSSRGDIPGNRATFSWAGGIEFDKFAGHGRQLLVMPHQLPTLRAMSFEKNLGNIA